MNLDRKSIIAIGLSFLLYVGYEFYLNKKYPNRFDRTRQQQQVAAPEVTPPPPVEHFTHTQTDSSIANTKSLPKLYPTVGEDQLTLSNSLVSYTFNQETAGVNKLVLHKHLDEDQEGAMTLVTPDNPLILQAISSHDTWTYSQGYQVHKDSGNAITFKRQDGPWTVEQHYLLDGYGLKVSVTWTNTSQQPHSLFAGLLMQEDSKFQEQGSGFLPGLPTGRPHILVNGTNTDERQDLEEYCNESKQLSSEREHLNYVAIDKHYFIKAILPQTRAASYRVSKQTLPGAKACRIKEHVFLSQGRIQPGKSHKALYQVWLGPKDSSDFAAFAPQLENSLDLGIFSVIAKPMLIFLKFLEKYLKNWGLAIVVFTIILKILFYPLTKKAAFAQHRMKKVQPELNKIKEKYKEDMQRQQQEVMRFMKDNKVNPLQGCLPHLPQIPVFIAFFRILSTAIELRHAPFFGWIQDLSVADPYYVTPVLLGVAQFAQQKLMPATGLDKSQERIMMMLPIIFAVMMITLPAGLVLYTLTNTLVLIVQQRRLNKRFG